MASSISCTGRYNGAFNYMEFICDSEDDIETLPTDCAIGSKAAIIETRRVYILNNEKQWKFWANASGSSGGSGETMSIETISDGNGNVTII